MPYVLGVDVGSSRMTAALCRRDGTAWGEPKIVRLGIRSASSAATLYLADAGTAAIGDDAEERARAEPGRVVRGIMRRVGDGIPVVLGGEMWAAEDLASSMICSIVEQVGIDEGEAAEWVVATHPPHWGSHQRAALHGALQRQGLPECTLLSEPVVIGRRHAVVDRVDAGDIVGIYLLGASDGRATVLRSTATGGFDLLANSGSGEAVGGARFDDMLADHVHAALGRHAATLDSTDRAHLLALRRLRWECTRAKEVLSTAFEVTIPVVLPGLRTEIRITRREFEKMIEPEVHCGIDTLERALRCAGVDPDRLTAVVLAGGSAGIPLVAESLSARLGCRIAVEAQPELAAARGAAMAGRWHAPGTRSAPPLSERHTTVIVPAPRTAMVLPEVPNGPAAAGSPPPRPSMEIPPLELPDRSLTARLAPALRPGVLSALVVAVIAIGAVLTFMVDSGQAGSQPQTSVSRITAARSSGQGTAGHPSHSQQRATNPAGDGH
ncbi:MAG: Hsp70 family protein [Sciscionella sp.]